MGSMRPFYVPLLQIHTASFHGGKIIQQLLEVDNQILPHVELGTVFCHEVESCDRRNEHNCIDTSWVR